MFDETSVGAATEKKGLVRLKMRRFKKIQEIPKGVGVVIIIIIIIIIIIMIMIMIMIMTMIKTVKRSLPSVSHPYKARRKQANEPVWLIG